LLVTALGFGAGGCDSTEPLPPAVFLAPASLTIEDGETAKLTAKLRNPKSRSVRWSSSNVAVATVDPFGAVSGVINGSATITAKMVDDTTVSASVPVTVSGPAVAVLTTTPAAATVYVGYAIRVTPQLRAADGRIIRGRAVSWASPDAAVADVTSQGIVRGRAPGGPLAVVASVEGRSATTLVRVAHDAEGCPFITPLALGQRADGRLSSGDCEFPLDESYVDVYEITLAAAASIQVDMVSSEIDAYLGFFDGTGRFLGEDDNSGGGRNARFVRQLDAGRYRIWANTLGGATAGAYSLTVTQR
jgi:hypothetical protein